MDVFQENELFVGVRSPLEGYRFLDFGQLTTLFRRPTLQRLWFLLHPLHASPLHSVGSAALGSPVITRDRCLSLQMVLYPPPSSRASPFIGCDVELKVIFQY